MSSPDADLLIVGGGLVGAALSLAAEAAGLDVILVDASPPERRAAPDFDGRAYALAHASIRCLDALGVWRSLAGDAEPIRRIELFDGRPGRRGPLRLAFDAGEIEVSPLAALVEGGRLRAALDEAVAARPRIRLRAPARAASAAVEPDRVVVALEEGGRLSGRVVAACDGANSPLAEAAGLSRLGRPYDQVGLVCALRCSRPHEGVARQIFYPGGPFAMLPLTGDRVSIVWSERGAAARRLAALDDAGYRAEVALRTGGLLGDVELTGGRWSYPLALSLRYHYAAPRLALVGDAAHAVHPVAGQGFNLALRDVAALAETLAEARRRGEDVGAPSVLARYERWRRSDATAFAAATDGIARLFSNDSAPLRAIRDMGFALVDRAPALKRAFMLEAAGIAGEPPRLMRGETP